MRALGLFWCVGFAALLTAVPAFAVNDEVTTTDGTTYRGEIIEENAEGVQIRPPGGGVITLRRAQVKDVKWDLTRMPASFHRAKGLFEAGQWDPAATNYELALEERSLKELLRPYLYKNLAICYTHLSESKHATPRESTAYAKKAIKAWTSVLTERGGKNLLVPEAVDKLADLYMRIGQYDQVLGLLPRLRDLGGAYRGKANLLDASVKEYKGDFDAALEAYARVAERFEDNPPLLNGARAGLLRCNLARGDLRATQREAERLLSAKPPPTDTAAAMAHLALGKLALAELGARLNQGRLEFDDRPIAAKIRLTEFAAEEGGRVRYYAKPMDAALLHLLRPVVQYKPDARTEAEALYLTGRCFELLYRQLRDAKDPAAKKEAGRHHKRARELYTRLQERRFTAFPWKAQAERRLAALPR